MSDPSFHRRALAFLRDEMALQCSHWPGEQIEDAHGNASFAGSIVDRRICGPVQLVGAYAIGSATILALFTRHPASLGWRGGLIGAAISLALAGIAAMIVGRWLVRRGTTPLHVVLRGDRIVDVDGISAARAEAGRAATWIVAAHEFSAEALADAARHSVRCFARRGAGIGELDPASGDAQHRGGLPASAA